MPKYQNFAENIQDGVDISESEVQRMIESSPRLQYRSDAQFTGNPYDLNKVYQQDAALLYKMCGQQFVDDPSWHYDAEPTVSALQRQLQLVDKQITYIDPADDKPLTEGVIVPIQVDSDPLAEEYIHYQVQQTGEFRRGSPQSTDIPGMESAMIEFSTPIQTYYGGFRLTPKEIALMARQQLLPGGGALVDLASLKERTLKSAAKIKQNDLIAYGDLDVGLAGLINHPQQLFYYPNASIDESTDPQDDLAILNSGARFAGNTERYRIKSVEPNTMAISIDLWRVLKGKPYTYTPPGASEPVADKSLKSTLDWFLEQNPNIKNIEWLTELTSSILNEKSGLEKKEHILFYQKNPEKGRIQYTTSLPVLMLPPKESGWGEILRVGYFNTAGYLMFYLNSFLRVVLNNSLS